MDNTNYRDFPSFTINFRCKLPNSNESQPLTLEIHDEGNSFEQSSDYMQFAESIASFTLLLHDSEYKGVSQYDKIISWLDGVHLSDEYGFKQEFKQLVEIAKGL